MISFIHLGNLVIIVSEYIDVSSSSYDHYIFFEDEHRNPLRMILSSMDEIDFSMHPVGTLYYESASEIFVSWDNFVPSDISNMFEEK